MYLIAWSRGAPETIQTSCRNKLAKIDLLLVSIEYGLTTFLYNLANVFLLFPFRFKKEEI